MEKNSVEFEIKVIGDALSRIKQLTGAAENLGKTAKTTQGLMDGIGKFAVGFNQLFDLFGKIGSKMNAFVEANNAQQEVEAKLALVMHNNMDAGLGEVDAIKQLASAQQALGVIGDEVQLAGAQEMGTYLEKTDSLKALIPVMNDMLAQQYGLNATQEDAVNIGSMMGKVLEGQVGALSRYGYKFDEAQEKILKYGTEEQKVATLAEVISHSVGGMNEALASTPEGKLKQVANAMGDIKERVGNLWVQLQTKLLPVGESMIAIANGLIDVVQKGWPVWIAAAAGVAIAVTKIRNKLAETTIATAFAGGGFMGLASVAKAACRSISTAIKSIPIVGWIAAGITIVIGVVQQLWTKCAGFRGLIMGIWAMIENMASNLWALIQPVFDAVWGAIQSVWSWIVTVFDRVKGLIVSVIGYLKNMFAGLWSVVQGILNKIVSFLAKVFNPIIELWNKVTGGNVAAFKSGYGEGNSQVKGGGGRIEPAGIPGTGKGDKNSDLGGDNGLRSAKAGAAAVATGGTRNTQITINLGKMIETVVFQEGTKENSNELQRIVEECLLRTLNAATAIG